MIEELKKPDSVSNEMDLRECFEKSRIDLTRHHHRPPLAISIGEDDIPFNGNYYPLRFGTFGNISIIKGEEKVRKSFLKSLLLACAIGGKANNYTGDLNISGHDLSDKYIIDIDAEQDDYDAWLNASRIPFMVGTMPNNYISLKWREYTPIERSQLLEWLFMESGYRNKLGVVSLDGYVDFVKDFNNLEQSTEFTQKLMKYSTLTKCHITGILHLNYNSDKGRGHLGTIIQQKCETVVIIKDMGDYSKITCQRGRGKRFPDFTIRVDKDWMPFVSDDDINIEPIMK